MGEKKEILLILGVLIFLALLVFVGAATLVSPSASSSHSGTMVLNCTTTAAECAACQNATFYYNKSGGAAGTMLTIIVNDTGDDVNFYNASYGISGLDDLATYNFTCMIDNGTDQAYATANAGITVDNTGMSSSLVSPANNTFDADGIVTFWCSATDGVGLSALKLYIWNATDEYVTNTTSVTGTSNSTTWIQNLSAEGAYTWNCLVNDTSNNLEFGGTSNRTITTDRTDPSVSSFSCTPTTVSKGVTITCSCTGTDALDSSPTVSYTANPSTSSSGTQTTTCTVTDGAGNSASSSVSYTVTGGGGDFAIIPVVEWTNTFSLDDVEFSEKGAITKELGERNRVKVMISGSSHSVGVVNVTATTVRIKVESDAQEAELSVGETEKFDVNNDRVYDIEVTLNTITNSKADMTITPISEAMPEEEAAPEEEGEEEEEVEKAFPTWAIVLIVVIVILVILAVVFGRKKK
jgi:hypothetical protein